MLSNRSSFHQYNRNKQDKHAHKRTQIYVAKPSFALWGKHTQDNGSHILLSIKPGDYKSTTRYQTTRERDWSPCSSNASKAFIFIQCLLQLYKTDYINCCPYLNWVVWTRVDKSSLNLGQLKPPYPNSCQIPNNLHLESNLPDTMSLSIHHLLAS